MLTASRRRVLSLEEHRNETVSLLSRYVPQGGPDRDNQRRSERRSTQEAIIGRAVKPRPGVRTIFEPVNAHYVKREQFSASDNFESKKHAVKGSYNSKSGVRKSKCEHSSPNRITKKQTLSKPENILHPACEANSENACSKLPEELIKLINKLDNNDKGLAAEMQRIGNVYKKEVDQGWKKGKGRQADGHSTIILNKLRQEILSKLETSLKNEKKPDDLFKLTGALRRMESAMAGNTNNKIAFVNTISAAVAAIATVIGVVGIKIAFPVVALIVIIAAIAYGITFGLRLIKRIKAKKRSIQLIDICRGLP